MKNIHLIPTDKPSRLHYSGNNKDLLLSKEPISFRTFERSPQNIYITSSDEEIKFYDYITDGYKVWQWEDDSSLLGRKKVILTTDKYLIKDGVLAIDDEFLEWFVKNPSCEEVETIYGLFNPMGRQVDPMNLGQNHSQCVWKYKIIIPKETKLIHQQIIDAVGGEDRFRKICKIEPKQETLEEAAERLYPVNNTGSMFMPNRDELNNSYKQEGFIDGYNKAKEERKQETLDDIEIISKQRIHKYRPMNPHPMSFFIGFNDGIEWNSERMYSEEEVNELLKLLKQTTEYEVLQSFRDKVEQFKKK